MGLAEVPILSMGTFWERQLIKMNGKIVWGMGWG